MPPWPSTTTTTTPLTLLVFGSGTAYACEDPNQCILWSACTNMMYWPTVDTLVPAIKGGLGMYWHIMVFTTMLMTQRKKTLYSVRGLGRSELAGSHGCPGRLGTDFYDRSILRPNHCAYYCSGRPVIKIGPKGSHEIRPIHSAPSSGLSITKIMCRKN